MEDVLDLYTQRADDDHPLICMDEAAKQLLDHDHPPLPMEPGKPEREDYHYQRKGTSAIFMFFDPHRGWRRTAAADSRTRVDWAEQIRQLLEEDYPQARKVRLVCDNLNTHHLASLYQAFPAEQAHRLARRLEIHYTPRNGSWLNLAEIELSVLQRQCLGRRIPTTVELAKQLTAWHEQRNRERSTVRWQLTTPEARVRLRKLYPQV